jgi:S-methylmethionine-dependent homocysteine/selenocysteine methylase
LAYSNFEASLHIRFTRIHELKRFKVNLPVGVYANAFPTPQKDVQANSTIQKICQELDPEGYFTFVDTWCRLGVTIIGGCCGIGPEHIATLHEWLKTK